MVGLESILPTEFDDPLMDYMDQRSLYRLSWTCKDFHDRVESYMRRTLKIERLLKKFFGPTFCREFRTIQYVTGLTISGSAALYFICCALGWEPNDMDLYVGSKMALIVTTWLEGAGYVFCPPSSKPNILTAEMALKDDELSVPVSVDYRTSGTVLDFIRGQGGPKIQVITVHGSVIECVLRFYTTCVMNAITYNKVYCLYPNTTLTDKPVSLLTIPSSKTRIRTAIVKYHKRGWRTVYSWPTSRDMPHLPESLQTHVQQLDSFVKVMYRQDLNPVPIRLKARRISHPEKTFPEGMRRVGDAQTWTYTLPNSLDELEPAPWPEEQASLIEANTWLFLFDSRRIPRLLTVKLRGQALTHAYTAGTKELRTDVQHTVKELWRKYGPRRDSDILAAIIASIEGGGQLGYLVQARERLSGYRKAQSRSVPTLDA